MPKIVGPGKQVQPKPPPKPKVTEPPRTEHSYTPPPAPRPRPVPVARPVQQAPPVPEPTRVRPDDRALPPRPSQPANPVLVKHGITNSTDEFVARVNTIVKSYQQRYGYPPTPGLVYDVARSKLDTAQIPKLFKDLPVSKRLRVDPLARKRAQDDRVFPNKHGVMEFTAPFSVAASQLVDENPQTWAEARASHPTVDPRMLPVAESKPGPYGYRKPGDSRGVYDAMGADAYLRTLADTARVTLDAARLIDPSKLTEKMLVQAAQYHNPYEPATGPDGLPLSGDALERWRKKQELVVRKAVKTVRGAQEHLLELFGSNGGTLKASGYFDDRWLKAIKAWSHTTAWIEAGARLQAQEAGASSYRELLNATHNKAAFFRAHPWMAHLTNALPTMVFKNGGSLGEILAGSHQFVMGDKKTLLGPEAISRITRTGTLAFGVMAGSISEIEAGAAMANLVGQRLLAGKLDDPDSIAKAKRDAAHVFMEHPSILRAAYPELPSYADEDAKLKAADFAVEAIASVLLMRKPIFMGPKWRAGMPIQELRQNSALNAHAANVFGMLRKRGDVYGAVRALEGGDGAEQLVVASAPLIQKGQMTQAEFRDHLANMVHYARTDIQIPARVSRAPSRETLEKRVAKFEKQWQREVRKYMDAADPAEADYRSGQRAGARAIEQRGESSTASGRNVQPRMMATEGEYRFQVAERRALAALERAAPDNPGAAAWLRKRQQIDDLQKQLDLAPPELAEPALVEHPVPAGHVRLYRGEGEGHLSHEDQGLIPGDETHWFTSDRSFAAAHDTGGGVWSVDVPKGVAAEHAAGAGTYELPGTIAATARRAADAAPEVEPLIPGGTQIASKGDLRTSIVTPEGPVLSSYRSKDLKSASALRVRTTKRAGDDIHRAFSRAIDQIEPVMRAKMLWPGGSAGEFLSSVVAVTRSQFGHAAPYGEARHLFEQRAPERIRQFVVRYNLGNGEEADAVAARFIMARANENIPAMMRIQDNLRARFFKLYGRNATPEEDAFEAGIQTELPSRFRFPGADEDAKLVKTWGEGLRAAGSRMHHNLLRLSSMHRHIILAGAPLPGGEVLSWKHILDDTGRRWVGGGFRMMDKSAKKWEPELEKVLLSDPQLMRNYLTAMARTKNGEARYLGTGRQVAVKNLSSVQEARYRPLREKYQAAVGGYVRRLATTGELDAVRASSVDNLDPLVEFLRSNREGVALYKAAVKRDLETRVTALRGERLSPAEFKLRKQALVDAPLTIDVFASEMLSRFNAVSDVLGPRGLTWDDLRRVVLDSHGDEKAVGKWVSKNRLEFEIANALVEAPAGTIDEMMVWWIGKLMTPNKWNRGHFGDNVFRMQYGALREGGMAPGPAVKVALDVSERQTVYHMFDFQNMLQIEKDLRYVSYFATKHRLYWKWIVSQVAHNPGLVLGAKTVGDVLDEHGNLGFQIKLWGQELFSPVARLFWINTSGGDLPQWSPLVMGLDGLVEHGPHGVLDSAGATLGNVISRNDQAVILGINYVRIEAGFAPKTITALTSGMNRLQQQRANRFANEYRADWEREHGHPPSNEEVYDWVKWRLVAMEAWRANLPLPVSFSTALDSPIQAELRAWGNITDPVAKRTYLEEHPELRDVMARSQNPEDAAYNNRYFAEFNTATNKFHSARDVIYREAQRQGKMTRALLDKRDLVTKEYIDKINGMLVRDALETADVKPPLGGEYGHQVPDGARVQFGMWGRKFQSDPMMDPVMGDPVALLHKLYPNVSLSKLEERVAGTSVQKARDTLAWLGSKEGQAAFANEDGGVESLKQVKRVLLSYLEPFQQIPSDKLGKAQRWYVQKVVRPYWKTNARWLDRIDVAPDKDKDALYAEWRDWKDSHDHPTKRDGILWPSPYRSTWENMEPGERKQRLMQMSAADPAHLAAVDLSFLGHPVDKHTQRGWDYYARLLRFISDSQPKNVERNQRVWAANLIEKGTGGETFQKPYGNDEPIPPHPGFTTVWTFARKTKGERMASYPYVHDSQFWDSKGGDSEKDFGGHPNWKNLLSLAGQMEAERKKQWAKRPDPDGGTGWLRKWWDSNLGEIPYSGGKGEPGGVLHWVQSDPEFWHEVELAGGSKLMNTLVARGG